MRNEEGKKEGKRKNKNGPTNETAMLKFY